MTLTETHVGLYSGLSQDPPPGAGLVPELLPLCMTTGLGWRIPQPPLAVLAFMDQWRNLLWPLVVTRSAGMEVAEVALAHVHTAYAGNGPYQMAAGVLVTLPVLVVCLLAQRHVMRGVGFTGARVRL